MLKVIRDAVNRCRWTQSELCELADIDQGQMSRFMAGKTGLSLATATRLCKVLGLELRKVK